MTDQYGDARGWNYIWAVIMPIVGAVLGIMLLAKSKIGPGLAVLATCAVAFGIWAAVLNAASPDSSTGNGSAPSLGEQCLVTVSGNKLCGEDAKAWCNATDDLRTADADTQSQAVCDEIRGY